MFLYHWSHAHDAVIDRFVSHLQILNRSPSTVESYRYCVLDFLRETTKPLENIEAEDVFRETYLRAAANDPATA